MSDFKAELDRRKAANEFKMMRGLAHHKEDKKINEAEKAAKREGGSVYKVRGEWGVVVDPSRHCQKGYSQ